jgi:hypothetical protein
VPLLPGTALAQARGITMWRGPGCGCCVVWTKRVEAAFGAKVAIVDSYADMKALKDARGVPQDLRSCHTAIVQGVVVEGHVPPEDIKRFVARRPKGIVGLAVPGMPIGSPGMEVPGGEKQRYQVFAFGPGGKRTVFATHGG